MTPARRPPPPHPGDVYVLAEPDYLYGIGPIILRVTAVVGQVEYDSEPWWQVESDAANGTPERHGGWVRRTAYLRESSLAAARRRPTAPPSPDALP